MRVNYVTSFLDGGTIKIQADTGEYYIDKRIKTDTKYVIYDRYPDWPGAQIVDLDSSVLIKEIENHFERESWNRKDYILNELKEVLK